MPNEDLLIEQLVSKIDEANVYFLTKIGELIKRIRDLKPYFDEDVYEETDVPFQKKLKATPHTKVYVDKLLYFYHSKREGSIA